jgi:hypothetical protein
LFDKTRKNQRVFALYLTINPDKNRVAGCLMRSRGYCKKATNDKNIFKIIAIFTLFSLDNYITFGL